MHFNTVGTPLARSLGNDSSRLRTRLKSYLDGKYLSFQPLCPLTPVCDRKNSVLPQLFHRRMDELAKVYKRAQSPDERRLILARGEELPDRTSQDQVITEFS